MGNGNSPERLNDAAERDALFDAIVEHGSVTKAADATGISESAIYLRARRDEKFLDELRAAQAVLLDRLVGECIHIADNALKDDWAVARLRIETRMRLAGKLIPRVYGDTPQTQVNVNQNSVSLVCSEEQRQRLIDMRNSMALPARIAELQDSAVPVTTTAQLTLVESTTTQGAN